MEMFTLAFALLVFVAARAAAKVCVNNDGCLPPFTCQGGICLCAPGYFAWQSNGIDRCRLCAPGCSCPGGTAACGGCAGGFYSEFPGAAACTACPPGTTNDANMNAGCDALDFTTPCANPKGPLGWTSCRPVPPPQNVGLGGQSAVFVPANNDALVVPPQYMAVRNDPYVAPYVVIPSIALAGGLPATFVALPVVGGAGTLTVTFADPAGTGATNPQTVALNNTGALGGVVELPSVTGATGTFNAPVTAQRNYVPSYTNLANAPNYTPNQAPPFYDVPDRGGRPTPSTQTSY